jgi:cytochrome c-type biogenesis protein CcmH
VTAFLIIATLMAAIACAWIVVPLMRGRSAPDIVREASNVAILRDQMAELDRDVASGLIAREQYDAARRELEQRVIEESRAAPLPSSAPMPVSGGAKIAVALAVVMPIAAVAIYFGLADRSAFDPAAQSAQNPAAHELSGQEVEEMVSKLAARLEKEPDNAEGWVVLARSYYALQRMPQAVKAFEQATKLVPDDAQLLADYADAVGSVETRLDGRALPIIERALKIDPTHWKALALAGTEAFNRKDYAKAVAYWEKMKATVPPGSQMSKSIDSSIAEARELGGLKASLAAAPTTAAPAPQPKAAPPAAPSASAKASSSGTAVAGEVKLVATLAGKVAPNDTVFVFARAAQGPKMPLAIVRMQVKDLPAKFAFDDSMAMTPEMKLSTQAEVVVGARISKSGQAMPQSGDLEGLSAPVKVGATNVAVVIDKTLP